MRGIGLRAESGEAEGSSMEAELICDYQCATGEGPLWHPGEERLYWIDIPAGRLFRYDPVTGVHEQVYQGEVIGGFTIQADGALLLFGEKGAVRLFRDGRLTTIIDHIPGEEAGRFNDVIADPEGRVFCGTMPAGERAARLFRLDPDGTLTTILDGVGLSNGMGFSPDRSVFYFTDSNNHVIYRFDYDQATGNVSNQGVFAHIDYGNAVPDGMTVDADGYIWSAEWDGGQVVRYAPDGTAERAIQLPTGKVSSVTFGGDGYSDLYITTAGGDDRAANGPHAGALFRLRIDGIHGKPEFPSRIRVPSAE
jgi:sugar lactone lactonase YvrE